ncbi:MAG: ring-cleaving dioxygenase [Fimbriimonas sp.]
MSAHTIHHVTAVTAQIAENLQFYTGVLGLRLVKRSVNQDDVSAYHLFYADAAGTPGTDMTFFDWPTIGPAQAGAATVSLTSFQVPQDSIGWWQDRLEKTNTGATRGEDDQERENIWFSDPEGQRLELVSDEGRPSTSTPWTAVVPAEYAIRGIVGVDLESARPDGTYRVLTELLGFTPSTQLPGMFETGDSGHYARIRLTTSVTRRIGRVGAGGVHHVAFRVDDEAELLAMQEKIEAVGLQTSGLIDRYYFKSLYFREPGGVLFELATDGPGFASDEPQETLGQRLALPPFLEPRRSEIEAGLKPLPAIL